jgi:hypothetical protein
MHARVAVQRVLYRYTVHAVSVLCRLRVDVMYCCCIVVPYCGAASSRNVHTSSVNFFRVQVVASRYNIHYVHVYMYMYNGFIVRAQIIDTDSAS